MSFSFHNYFQITGRHRYVTIAAGASTTRGSLRLPKNRNRRSWKTLPERATRKQLKQQLKEMDEYIPQQRRRVDAWTLKELEPVAYA